MFVCLTNFKELGKEQLISNDLSEVKEGYTLHNNLTVIVFKGDKVKQVRLVRSSSEVIKPSGSPDHE